MARSGQNSRARPARSGTDSGAGATLTVDLVAIVDNYRRVRDEAPGAETAAVVKADAYGLGMEQVAPALAEAGCQTFFVALPREGVTLRRLLSTAEVAVFSGPDPSEARLYAEHRLTPVLNSLAQIEIWRQASLDQPAMLHLDTGMSRLGLTAGELSCLAADPSLLDGVEVSAVMSHLACADEPDHPLNRAQLEAFHAALTRLPASCGGARASLANSSGIFLGADFHFDLVRPGAALYGIAPQIGRANPLRQVVHLHAKILQVRDVDSPMTVGYGATHRVSRAGRLATVAAGYADGYIRALGNSGRAYIAGRPVPVVGRVSMDLTTVDVSDIPAELARPGGRVELIGEHARTDDVAAEAGTIGYELLTGLGQRCDRVYRGES
ncbi:MAG: alanine racemase [Alphaproteobacteria bacterium]